METVLLKLWLRDSHLCRELVEESHKVGDRKLLIWSARYIARDTMVVERKRMSGTECSISNLALSINYN
jgi:hypothetical protein